MQQPSVLEIGRFIDEHPFSRYQLQTVVLCGIIVFMDGFDAQAMGFVAPRLAQDLHIRRAAMGPLFSSGLLGMMIGALVFGPLADRLGRRPVLIASTLIFGVFSLFTATSASLQSMFVFRLLTGLGLGGAMPNTIALTSEYTPRRFRATAVMTMFCGFSIGAAVGGLLAAGLITRFGWQAVFIVGGTLPCLVAVLSFFLLPESMRFLVLQGGQEQRVANYLARVAPGFRTAPDLRFEVTDRPTDAFVVKQLFTRGRASLTLLIWVVFFMSLLDLYFLNNWLPTIIHDAGVVVETAIIVTALFQLGGTVGSLTLGRLIDRHLSFRVLGWAYLAAAASVFLLGAAGASLALLIVTVFASGFSVIGGQTGANALAAEFYPTAIRSTGVGWALGIGRVGSIIGPILGGVLLARVTDVRRVFWAAAVPPLVAMAAAMVAASITRKDGPN
jgi:MFS transporter, AAHS family, 4-hydroxybenzoate transporter